MKAVKNVLIACVIGLMLSACGGGEDGGGSNLEMPDTTEPVDTVIPEVVQPPTPYAMNHVCDDTDFVEVPVSSAGPDYHCSIDDVISYVDNHVCTDEYGQALHYSLGPSVPGLWDGDPFVVDISDTFSNANDLLEIVRTESERIRLVLGYEVFIAGDVIPLEDLTQYQAETGNIFPLGQRIEIRCCYGEGTRHAGIAYPDLRMILLRDSEFSSRHIITHELYHLLGFSHPRDAHGVEMSDIMMRGSPFLVQYDFSRSYNPSFSPTQPSAFDLARLDCIFN